MSLQLTDAIALDLLQKLAQDEAFRSTFSHDPAAALESLGLNADAVLPAGARSSLKVQSFASKQALAASHSALNHKQIEAMAPFIPITLEITAPRRQR